MTDAENLSPNRLRLRREKARQNEALREEIVTLKAETRVAVGLKQTECARLRSKILERGASRALRRADRDMKSRSTLPGTPQFSAASAPGPAFVTARESRGASNAISGKRGPSKLASAEPRTASEESPPLTPISRNHALRRDLQLAERHLRASNKAMDARISLLQSRASASPEEPAPAHHMAPTQVASVQDAATAARAINKVTETIEARATQQAEVCGGVKQAGPQLAGPLGHACAPAAPQSLDVVVAARQHASEGWLGTDASFTVYEVNARERAAGSQGTRTQTVVAARYSQLLEDHRLLLGRGVAQETPFPPRTSKLFVHHMDPAFVERRREQLERYVRELARDMTTVAQLRKALPISAAQRTAPKTENPPAKRRRTGKHHKAQLQQQKQPLPTPTPPLNQPVVRVKGALSWLMVPFATGSTQHRQTAL